MIQNKVVLFEEFKLIEKSESEISVAWKGAHLLLFFLAFVFGSFCTFCFHMLMYMFDEKCVLFPKLLSVKSVRHNVIYEFIPSDKDLTDMPVDFVSTQWVGQNMCALPTYVPLLSGILGLVWTTLFLMCSTGSRTLTGLQRPWRVLPPVFIFSLLMGGLCCYTSTVTHSGLHELCVKLGEITGSTTCTYTVNVATLTYERRIRGVYQATRLTILTAWLHTSCWLLSALLVVIRVVLAIDFQLVKVTATLHGDVDKMLRRHEVQMRTVLPDTWVNSEYSDTSISLVQFNAQHFKPATKMQENSSDSTSQTSAYSKTNYIARADAYKKVTEENQFIVDIMYDILETLPLPHFDHDKYGEIGRNKNKKKWLKPLENEMKTPEPSIKEIYKSAESILSTDRNASHNMRRYESEMNISPELQKVLESRSALQRERQNLERVGPVPEKRHAKKSNLKHASVQTNETWKKKSKQRVQITETGVNIKESSSTLSSSSKSSDPDNIDKETQTQPKEKQD